MKKTKIKIITDGKRIDGRKVNQIRDIKISAGIIDNADGSAYIEWGNNKIIAAVYGPKEAQPRHMADSAKAIIKCRYSMAPFSSLEGRGRSGPNRRAIEISKVIKEVFENVVMLNEFPGSEIDIFIEVLQSDGGTRAAGITAASVALANAGIPMKDIVYSISCGKAEGHVILDLDMIEDNYSSDMPVAIAPRNNDILLLQMDGEMTKEEFNKAMSMVIEAGKHISQIQKSALREVYKAKLDESVM